MLTKFILFGWIAVVQMLFAFLPKRVAVITAFVGGWLFLPVASVPIPGLPDYSKLSAITVSVAIGVVIFDPDRLIRFRPSWLDGPITVFCIAACVPSFTMGLGAWDAASAMIQQVLTWLIPYLIGRIYFRDLAAFRQLAIGIIVGGLIYVPFCLLETRLSPQLHHWIYGYYPRGVFGTLGQARRFGGWRPTVFLEHGLAVGIWMSNASLLATWLWMTGSARTVFGLRMFFVAAILLVTTILCKSTGAIFLLFVGLGSLLAARSFKREWPIGLLLLISPIWMTLRTLGIFDGKLVRDLFHEIHPERAQSFAYRLDQEDVITLQALEHPYFGGGRWFEDGADQLWLLTFRNFGAVGLTAFTLFFLLPSAWMLVRTPTRLLLNRQHAPALALSVAVSLHMIDHLVNGMVNPVLTMATGAVTSAALAAPRYRNAFFIDQQRRRRLLTAQGRVRSTAIVANGHHEF